VATLREIVFDCERPAALARFWSAVLDDYHVRPYSAEEIADLAARGLSPETDPVVLVDGPGPLLCFQRRPGPLAAAGPGLRPRLHLDVRAASRRAEVNRLVALGAAVQREAASYTVLRDPEGNPFCVQETRKDP
jgi:hypothetical protein